MICVECGAEMRKCSDPIETDYRDERIVVRGIEHHRCDSCGEIVFDADEGKRFDAEVIRQYAVLHDLLTPEEIRAIRKGYGLNQREFERVLGVSAPSVSRWETGRVQQSKPVDLLMRAYRDDRTLMKSRMEQCEIEVGKHPCKVISFFGYVDKKSGAPAGRKTMDVREAPREDLVEM